ncbi:GlxA family transcriptional regulator [Rhizobium deserti]|uniref:GlxA family transcriptional regulator n=1 Tax=Rhizobium deserti TaxID=2547961 RepID=A0A4R5UMY8_9HYPH|nr:GlxA family transcriptional regulator [Rhizobium deserti]TDK39221.1 GlxA family transcriptional regulator [Rhizobium deserti]
MKIALLIYPDFQAMSLEALSVFELANQAFADPPYEVATLSWAGGPVRSSAGFTIGSEKVFGGGFDTLLVAGGMELPTPPAQLLEWLTQAGNSFRRIGGICTGTFVLAQAGLLGGRRCTTHWMVSNELGERFPDVAVEHDRIFVVDGPIWTSAGMSAGTDLALAMVENDHGRDIAGSVADKLLLYHRRSGTDGQRSALLALAPRSDRIRRAISFAREKLSEPLPVERLAEAASLSPRQFSRMFRAETGQTPARAVERLRVEAARVMIETTRHPMGFVATETGFMDAERMRRAFVRTLGHPPQGLRRIARTDG